MFASATVFTLGDQFEMPVNDLAKGQQGLSLFDLLCAFCWLEGLLRCSTFSSNHFSNLPAVFERRRGLTLDKSALYCRSILILERQSNIDTRSHSCSINYFSGEINSTSTLREIKKLFSIEPSPLCAVIPATLLSHRTAVNHLAEPRHAT